MAATDKAQLLALTTQDFAKLETRLDGVDADHALLPHPQDGVTIKDTAVHRAHWIDLFLGWVRDGQAGKPVTTPAPGYKWNQLKAYNAKLRADTASVSWSEARTRRRHGHAALLSLLTDCEDSDLYTTGLYPWMNTWTLGHWAEASGPSHYRSAAKYIREILRKTT